MADEKSIPKPSTGDVHVEHYCQHPGCRRWGSFGYDKRTHVDWFCGEHRPEARQ